ncbi:MAG: ATP-binding protein [Elusimicrobiota bacterium]
MDKIPVTIDKSHLVTIGERLYSESIELLRELVNNAYDADASEVKITISENQVEVEDNGSGMDIEGLKQYFNIGSPFKKENPKSPVYGRTRIGEFGIGKFSTLSASKSFTVISKKDNFAAKVTFDKKNWETSDTGWELPFEIIPAAGFEHNGTKVTLSGLKKKFDMDLVEKRLIEALPLKAPNFNVYLNGNRLQPRAVSGKRIPFLEGTDYGIIHGEIIILPASKITHEEAGILVRVKQVAVKRLPFGIDSAMLPRVTGEVNADFLVLTSDRNDFIRDSKEFAVFQSVMSGIIERVNVELSRQSDEKENSRIKRTMKEITEKISNALMKNIDWCPPGLIPQGAAGGDSPGAVSSQKKEEKESAVKTTKGLSKKKLQARHARLKQLTPSALVKKMKIGQMNLALVLDHFGPDSPEAFIESEIIYLNRDHPLYIRESRNRERHIMNVARLICQEISLLSNPKDARHAYERQSRLLKDAFIK